MSRNSRCRRIKPNTLYPLWGYRSKKRKFIAFLLLLNELSGLPLGAPVAYRGCFGITFKSRRDRKKVTQ